MSTLTTNYSLIKPGVNDPTDQDLWGGYLNTDLDTIDTVMKANSDLAKGGTTDISGNYTVLAGDRNKTIIINAGGGNIVVTLLAAATATDGFDVTFKRIDSSANTVTIDGASSETIDGAATVTIDEEDDALTIVTDGAEWFIKSELSAAQSSTGFLQAQDKRASGANSGTFTSGAWRTRTLAQITNTIVGASVASNQITLPVGDYYIEASAPAHRVDSNQARIQNITAGTTIYNGTGEYAQGSAAGQSRSWVWGSFSLLVPTVIELQHQCLTTFSSYGFGYPSTFGDDVIYSDVKVWKNA